jgi:hypothetical protein
MVAVLPIPIKNRNIRQKRLGELRQTNRQVLNEVLRYIFHPLTFTQNLSAQSGYYNILCADGNFWRCKPVLQHGLQMAQSIVVIAVMIRFSAMAQDVSRPG